MRAASVAKRWRLLCLPFQHHQDEVEYVCRILVDILIVDSKDAISLFLEKEFAPAVIGNFIRLGMRRAVDLHDETGTAAKKVNDIGPASAGRT